MNADFFIFPFLFITLYFESFLLVTFLSAPARKGRERGLTEATPHVAIIVPCFNEETTIGGTVESLLALDYPKDRLDLILVNDGSTDGTAAVMDSYQGTPQITIIHQKNGGKHTAINAGIAATTAGIIGCLDADSFVASDALREIITCFDDPKVGAATPAMSVHNARTILERMQNAEYIFGITLRHVVASMNGLYVTPGPFSLYRKQMVLELGGFKHAHQAEDLEMALRIQRDRTWRIDNAPRARVYTKTPRTIPKLIKQRTRWTTGFLRNALFEYRSLIGNPQYGTLGLVILPMACLAIVSGLLLFMTAILTNAYRIFTTLSTVHGVPLAYIFRLRSFEWFYLPISFVLVLGAIMLTFTITLMVIGKKISNTPGSLVLGIIAYLLLYGLIAPLWLMRAVTDVAIGKRRAWR